MKTLSSIILVFTLTASCNKKPAQTDKRKILEDSIKYTLGEYLRSLEGGKLENRLAFYDDSSAFYWIPEGSSACLSRDSLFSMLRSANADSSVTACNWSSLEIRPLNEDYVNFKGLLEKKTAAGLLRSMEEGVLVKRSTRWKFLFGHSSTLK